MTNPHATVLVVDDEVRSIEAIQRVLSDEFEVIGARNAKEAEEVLEGEMVQVILCDQRMPGESGVEFLKRVRELWPDTIRIIISGYTDSVDIIEGVNNAGIYQYITKPWSPDKLIDCVRESANLWRLQHEVSDMRIEVKPASEALQKVISDRRRSQGQSFGFDRIIHRPESPLVGSISLAKRAARYDVSVLVTGASGTGKELLARAIHQESARADRPFVVENCGALPDELLESELFGCKKGAYTGAYQDRIGLFELADSGTIFLDEIGETSPAFQVKLLRVLQEGEIRPLGAQRPRKVNVRVISATNRDLLAEVAAGRFRRDLYYRLAAFPIHMPALKDRVEDIPAIAARILTQINQSFNRQVAGFHPRTLDLMTGYAWPGNVRELQNEIQRMTVLSDGNAPLAPDLLSPAIRNGETVVAPVSDGAPRQLKDMVEEIERAAIEASLARHEGNISRTADELGLSRVGLRSKIERYDLRRYRDDETD
ncbi:sigma-54-dependent Fis family transcriptional regulator [Rhizobium sp. S-51]|uniref:Sigma-54-dependent Fis family transcriptional regulator n=1 Tax=Rhizobium terricola TaxID=2728849 RepID=A0A7Y0FXJ9_9HYPH|nr:sigma-54 dependent transcriptional regulator [Rhizobium terricola]NML76647.1 sigma-54-dependent Fis family transcriptional regulator [Rhizobium terricola]